MRKAQILRIGLYSLAAVAAAWLIFRFLMPFVLGLVTALIAEKAVRFLQKKGVCRTISAVLCVLAFDVLLGLGLFFLIKVLFSELNGLVRRLPSLAAEIAPMLMKLKNTLLRIASKFPDGIGTGLRSGISELFQSGSGKSVYEGLFSFASGLLQKAPGIVLFCATSVISGFFVSAELPCIAEFLQKKLPPAKTEKLRAGSCRLRQTLGKWLIAQAKLMGITFLLLTAGFLLLRTDYPLLTAMLVTLVDALPVLGTGCILIPWGILAFLRQKTFFAGGLLILYALSALTRQVLEPRLVGRQLGLNPLVTLMAMYVGFGLIGVAGMIVFPIGAILLRQLWDSLRPNG